MAKTIQMRTPQQEKEARLVAGMYDKNRKIQSELYAYCSRYFWANYRGVFFADEESATEIFQNTFIAMWENIERRKIYVSDGRVMGKNNEPLSGSILTYFMGIARIKYLEWVREHPAYADPETEMERKIKEEGFDAQQYTNMLYDSEDNKMLDIIADVISHMSERCSEILSKFYYEEKDLDTILLEIHNRFEERPQNEEAQVHGVIAYFSTKHLSQLFELIKRQMDMNNNNFQDRIDEYLLHGDTMSEEDKAQFLKEIEEDAEKKEQYEFTKNVKQAMVSRGEKLKAMTEFQKEMKSHHHRKTWLWISSIAAVLVIGFFAINPLFVENSPTDNVRGDENDVFDMTVQTDSINNDSISTDTISLHHE